MKKILILIIVSLSFNIYSQETLGLDSGNEPILLYKNIITSSTALVLIGGMHGDELDTIKTVNYLFKNLNPSISLYAIPSLNPTLSHISSNRRGYLSDNLDNNGFVIDKSKLTDFDKGLFYRIFYGRPSTYNNGIGFYVDPNRDFINKKLPSTRILIDFINKLLIEHKSIVIISFHGYMKSGRVYPEYTLTNDKFNVDSRSWDMVKIICTASGFEPQIMYPPAIPILDRFSGELIAYTGNLNNVTAMDLELDSEERLNNNIKSLKGIQALITYILNEQ